MHTMAGVDYDSLFLDPSEHNDISNNINSSVIEAVTKLPDRNNRDSNVENTYKTSCSKCNSRYCILYAQRSFPMELNETSRAISEKGIRGRDFNAEYDGFASVKGDASIIGLNIVRSRPIFLSFSSQRSERIGVGVSAFDRGTICP